MRAFSAADDIGGWGCCLPGMACVCVCESHRAMSHHASVTCCCDASLVGVMMILLFAFLLLLAS